MELQLFNKEQALSILDLLTDNHYTHINNFFKNTKLILSDIKNDLIHHKYEIINKSRNTVTITYIHIDEENKTYNFITKLLNIDLLKDRKYKIYKILKI